MKQDFSVQHKQLYSTLYLSLISKIDNTSNKISLKVLKRVVFLALGTCDYKNFVHLSRRFSQKTVQL